MLYGIWLGAVPGAANCTVFRHSVHAAGKAGGAGGAGGVGIFGVTAPTEYHAQYRAACSGGGIVKY